MTQLTKLFTIGFTRKSARQFFEGLRQAGVKTLIDTRLNNTSQLAGFAKHLDLKYFLEKISYIDYVHNLNLAPESDLLEAYKKKKIPWDDYAHRYLNLLEKRQVENQLTLEYIDHACFLCSEDEPHHCHRRLAAEYLQSYFPTLEIFHL